MLWLTGGVILYLVLIVTLGVLTFRRGHYVLFGFGFFFPVLWLIGAILSPAPGHGTGRSYAEEPPPEHHGRVTTNPN